MSKTYEVTAIVKFHVRTSYPAVALELVHKALIGLEGAKSGYLGYVNMACRQLVTNDTHEVDGCRIEGEYKRS